MRASVTAEALSQSCALSTAVVPVSTTNVDDESLAWAKAHSEKAVIVPLSTTIEAAQGWLANAREREILSTAEPLPKRARLASPALGEVARGLLAEDHYDIVWVMRLYLAGAALPFLDLTERPRLVMDADEDDSAALFSIARLDHISRDRNISDEWQAEAKAYARLAQASLGLFDEVVTASAAECTRFREAFGLTNLTTIPNAIRLDGDRPAPSEPIAADRPSELLFIGNLDYPPNRDAVNRLVSGIFPIVRARLPDARVHIIGARDGGEDGGWDKGHLPPAGDGVQLHGYVTDLGPFYNRARATIVPLVAGGGSRIKILEAFAKGTPVVATPEAAAGLNVVGGEHLLIGSSDQELADGVTKLIADRPLAETITTHALAFVCAHHDAEKIMKIIARTALGA
jgi:glycosyltransferase involved in cell wall biosynthesis